MTKLSSLRRLSREDMQGAPEWVDQLLQASNEFQEQATGALGRDLLVGTSDTFELKHAAERIIKNPYGDALEGVEAVRCIGINVDSSGKPTGTTYALAQPRISWRHVQARPGEDARIGVTACFSPPHGNIDVRRNAAQTIAAGAGDPVQFDTSESAAGDLSCDVATTTGTPPTNSQIACAKAGKVLVTASATFDTSGAAVKRFWLQINNSSSVRWGFSTSTITGYYGVTVSAIVPVAAGDYIQLIASHSDVAGVALLSGADVGPRLQARYAEPPSSTTGRVTLRFDGGN